MSEASQSASARCGAGRREAADVSGSTLKAAALKSGKVDEKTFDAVVDPHKLVGHGVAGA